MKKSPTFLIGIFKKVTGGAMHAALMRWSLIALLFCLPLLIVPSFVDIHGPVKQAALVILTDDIPN